MSSKYGTDRDPYCYENSDTLINILDIRNPVDLENAEQEITSLAAEEIPFCPPPYDFAYWKRIHALLFGDLYPWAGKIREVVITKGETVFCYPQFIESQADFLLGNAQKKEWFVQDTREELVADCAELFAELNAIHPFREGNGRTQRILFEHICGNCGYSINWSEVSVDEWIGANISGFHGNYRLLALIFERIVSWS